MNTNTKRASMLRWSRNFNVSQFSVEVAARGFITRQNKARLKAFAMKTCDVRSIEVKILMF